MIIAIAPMGPNTAAPVAFQFGRAPYYIFHDTEKDTNEAVQNGFAFMSGGAGIQAAQLIAERGARMLVIGNIPGPNTSMVLQQAGMEVVSGYSGTVADAMKDAKDGRLRPVAIQAPGPDLPMMPYPQPYSVPTTPEEEVKYIEGRISVIEEKLEEINKQLEE